ncbi:MAG: ribosome maturation factor RimP [Acidobacteriota bacterium]|nr:ribosome maturation factor RimP [Acidobacteriota bacterium]
MAGSQDAIRALLEPALSSAGLELWDIEVSRHGLRVLVDRPGGVDLDALAQAAGEVVSPLLDEHPELTPDGQFDLEVSSPGVERNLSRLDHYLRYLGSEVSVKTKVVIGESRRHQGVLVAADEEGIVLDPMEGSADRTVAIGHDQIERARTVLVWGPAPKPGSAQRKSTDGSGAVKRPAASGRKRAEQPVASRERDTE